jgi:hypothetical protein
MSQSNIPHYKTLDIIEFYDQVYDFVSRYLIFVLAWIFAVIATLIIWIWEPDTATLTSTQTSTWVANPWYITQTGLIYPANYFAAWSLNFDWDNKIFWLGWPIWRNQWMWNSIDNIVQYNGVILPRQISRSAWVPKLQQAYYSESMIRTFLEGMGTSQADINLIKSDIVPISKATLDGSLFNTFGIGCTSRSLFTTIFCNLKLQDAIPMRNAYDLSGSISELTTIHNYVFTTSRDTNIAKNRCTAMIEQYRYSAAGGFIWLTKWCDADIVNEAQYIENMIAINQEVGSNQYTSKVYINPIINRYKLMSWYQYFMSRIQSNQFVDGQDDVILETYDAYITKLTDSNSIVQPYGDIIAIFHQQYLIPWLTSRDSFASIPQREFTQSMIATTNLIVNGDTNQWIVSVSSWSRLKSIEFLVSQGMYYDNSNTTWSAAAYTTPPSTTSGSTTTNTTTWTINPTPNTWAAAPQPAVSSIDGLIAKVLGTTPTSTPTKRWQIILIKYNYKWAGWIVSVDLSKKGITQIYYDSPVSGATKITHPQVIFNTSNTELILAIMNNYLSTNPQ